MAAVADKLLEGEFDIVMLEEVRSSERLYLSFISYRPQTKLRKVNVFIGVGLSVILSRDGGGRYISGRSRIFPRGCANSQIEIILQFFCQKLHGIERIWTPGGPWRPLDPPMHIMQHAIGYMVGYPPGHHTYPLPIPAGHQTWDLPPS